MSDGRTLDPIPPGEILRFEFMEPLGLSQNQLARDLDVPVARISELVHGRRGISADTALRLEKYFGVEAQFWLNLQSRYDLKIARRDIWPTVEPRVRTRRSARASTEEAGSPPEPEQSARNPGTPDHVSRQRASVRRHRAGAGDAGRSRDFGLALRRPWARRPPSLLVVNEPCHPRPGVSTLRQRPRDACLPWSVLLLYTCGCGLPVTGGVTAGRRLPEWSCLHDILYIAEATVPSRSASSSTLTSKHLRPRARLEQCA